MAIIEIDTIQKLVDFSNGNYGKGTSTNYLDVKLTADLDFVDLAENDTSYSWAGCTGTWYCNFNGQGHKIDNIYYTGETWSLFYELYGSIKNLKLTNVHVVATQNIGGYVINARGAAIENCKFSGYLESSQLISGCILNGYSNCSIVNCSYNGTLKNNSGSEYAFAWLGGGDGGNSIAGCLFMGNMIANKYCAVFGFRGLYTNCEFKGITQSSILTCGAYDGILRNCIFICEDGSYWADYNSWGTNVYCYYDSDKAAIEDSPQISNFLPATTAELKSKTWLKTHNFMI